jgi:NAD(P)-dependent dehydrogenase (short-subunit alcohol dehydrogenase family)
MRANVLGAFLCAKKCAPGMVARGSGVILFTGATAGIKAGARSIAVGPGNFAKRGLAQSLARDLGPKGIHVAWINIDGVIDLPHRQRPNASREDMLSPDAIAEIYWHLAH